MMKRILLAVAVFCLASGLAAHADTVTNYSLTVDGCSGAGCGTAPYGTVKVDQTSTSSATITVTLDSGYAFADSGDAVLFDASGDPNLTISGTGVEGFDKKTVSTSSTKIGSFYDGVSCDYSQGGKHGACYNKTDLQTLTFTVSTTNSSALSFIANSDGVYFAVDVNVTSDDIFDKDMGSDMDGMNCGGDSGYVGAKAPLVPPPPPPPAPTPEPSSLMLLGTGALGLAGVVRRRFRCC